MASHRRTVQLVQLLAALVLIAAAVGLTSLAASQRNATNAPTSSDASGVRTVAFGAAPDEVEPTGFVDLASSTQTAGPTAEPTEVAAPEPTPTAAPTLTPAPAPTATPVVAQSPPGDSTATPAPRPTPVPTATAAPTPTAVPQPTATPQPSLTDQALARIAFDWRPLGYTLEFKGPHDSVRGLTFPYEQRIEIYVRSGDTADLLARVLAHEIGHAVDVAYNSADERYEWLTARGLADSTAWWPGNGLNDFAVGAGDFAECFATWQVGSASKSELAGPCTSEQIALVARLAQG